MNKKIIYTLMIAACSAALLFGCGEAQNTTTESNPAETVKEPAAAETTEEAKTETLAETSEAMEEVREDPSEEETVDLQETSTEVQALDDSTDYSFLMSEEYQKMAQAMIDEKVANTKLTLDKKDSSDDVNSLEDGHFITKDNVQCREVKITCGDGVNGEMMYWFGIYLYNETGEPKDFDPTKFMIETKSGQLVYPCLMNDDLITVKSDTQTNQSFTLVDTKDLAPDEEATIYYDGVLISTVKVSKN